MKYLLEPEEITSILCKYAIDLCVSNPIQQWNNTELIKIIAQAQLSHALPLIRQDVAREISEKINEYFSDRLSMRIGNWKDIKKELGVEE